MAYDEMLQVAQASPQPGAQPTGSPSSLLPPETPATTPEELEVRKRGWSEVWQRLQSDTNLLHAIGTTGARLAQPLQHGQTAGGNLSNAIQAGQNAYQAGEYNTYQMGREMSKDRLEAAESGARVRASNASTANSEAGLPAIQSSGRVALATEKDRISNAKSVADTAVFNLKSARNEEAVKVEERKIRMKKAEILAGIDDDKIRNSALAELEKAEVEVKAAKERIKASGASVRASNAAAGASSELTRERKGKNDFVAGLSEEDKADYYNGTGKYSKSTSGIVQQEEMWGRIWDKLSATDPDKAGTTRAQFQKKMLLAAKQQDALTALTKYQTSGGDDAEIISMLKTLATAAIAGKAGRSATDNSSITKMEFDANGKLRPVKSVTATPASDKTKVVKSLKITPLTTEEAAPKLDPGVVDAKGKYVKPSIDEGEALGVTAAKFIGKTTAGMHESLRLSIIEKRKRYLIPRLNAGTVTEAEIREARQMGIVK